MRNSYLILQLINLICLVRCDENNSVLKYQTSRPRQSKKLQGNNKQVITPQEILNVSRVYAYVNKGEFQKFNSIMGDEGNQDDYEYLDRIGEGSFSQVYYGQRKSDELPVVLKIMKAYKNRVLNREIAVLRSLQNSSEHIVNMIDVIKDTKKETAILVYSYVGDINFAYVADAGLNLNEIQFYMFQLFMALDESHSRGIIHRDIKPANIIVNEESKRLILIDWGIGEFYHPGQNYSTKPGTRNYKAPELLIGNEYYDYAVDVWAVGCIIGELILKRVPVFPGEDNNQVLQKIITILGTKTLDAYVSKFHLTLSKEVKDLITPHHDRQWSSFIKSEFADLATKEGIDLLNKILIYDHRARLTAKEAMAHEFFDPVRDQFTI